MAQYLRTLITGIAVTDIIDILIVAFFIYKVLGFIKNSRAEQLAKGLLVLVVVVLVSGWFNLYTVNWILSQLLSVGLIALVVVFQPELRRGLEYMGRRSFSIRQFGSGRGSDTKPADVLSSAVGYFSSTSTGALIVIERQTSLSDVAETGTVIDARLSPELIENIFYEGSPLHDGAVIIRDDRIYAAGCMLPLTENPNLSKDLGTRHRAGIGISEVSDSIVLIVSEETGIISMAEDGKLSRFLDVKTVEKALLAHYVKEPAAKTPFLSVLKGMITDAKK